MTTVLYKTLLDAFVEGYVQQSKTLHFHSFGRRHIALAAFPGGSRKYVLNRLSERCSPKCPRPLDAVDLQSILDACRELLRKQYGALAKSAAPASRDSSDKLAEEFEQSLCRRLNLSTTGRAMVDDFRVSRVFEEATRIADFGLPDILEWSDETLGFGNELSTFQARSVELLAALTAHIGVVPNDQRRLKLLEFVIGIATLNHPGSRWHQQAFNLAMAAAGEAKLHLIADGYGFSDSLRKTANRLVSLLNWARFIPTLESSTNYTRCALRSRPLPPKEFSSVRKHLEGALCAAEQAVIIDPTDAWAIRGRSGSASMMARLLAVTGNQGALREADALHKDSLRDLDRVAQPYGYAYPILKDIVQSKFKAAIRKCEEAISVNQAANERASAGGFAALLVHLTALYGSGVTSDPHYRRIAAEALDSPVTRYRSSHIFDATGLETILRNTRGPKRRTKKSK